MEKLQPPRESWWERLVVRRWLIVYAAIIIAVLAAAHDVPLGSTLLAIAAFTAGVGIIPRVRSIYMPPALRFRKETSPETVVKAIIEGLTEPVIVLNREGDVLFFNGKAHDLFSGLRSGWHISGAIRNPRVLDAVASASRELRSQTVSFSERVPVERHLSVTVVWIGQAKKARDPAILLCLRDLTERELLDQMRTDFIANASHELKTPLASLLGFIETLQGSARHDEKARERFLGIMAEQAKRMARLIDNLMSLNRVLMRAHLRPRDRVDIAGVIHSAAEAMDPLAKEAGISLDVDPGPAGAVVLGDRDELTQLFMNLIHNAIKYGKPEGKVAVTVDRVPANGSSRVRITVEDDGPGIPEHHLPRLTERFYRVPDPARPERAEGTGLGLAIVKHVVNRHRGDLRIESKLGEGSRFTVILEEAPSA